MALAIEIRCAGNGGRCSRRIGVAETIPGRQPTSPLLYLSNTGWATDNGYPLLEDVVRADFSGSTGILACPKHGFLIIERSRQPSPVPGYPSGRWADGMSVQMPFALLREPYEAFRRTGAVQTMAWMPTARSAVYSE